MPLSSLESRDKICPPNLDWGSLKRVLPIEGRLDYDWMNQESFFMAV